MARSIPFVLGFILTVLSNGALAQNDDDRNRNKEDEATCLSFLPGTRNVIYGTTGGQICTTGPDARILCDGNNPVVALAVDGKGQKVAASFLMPLQVKVYD